MNPMRPAWSRQSMVLRLPATEPIKDFSPDWALGNSRGAGIRVAVIDSGIEANHPHLGDSVDVDNGVAFTVDSAGDVVMVPGPHEDVYGHGTACAGIIHALAPEASITSVKVLDQSLRGKAAAFHAGLEWAVDQGFDIINLSLGAGRREWALAFHELCDRAYFANSFVVTAANNIQRDSFPSLYASVASVASNTSRDPLRFHFNPDPPTEFLARGIDVEVPWLGGTTIVTTGNSFAAPHIAAIAALIRSNHPELRPFQVKTALWAASANVRESSAVERAGRHPTVGARHRLTAGVPRRPTIGARASTGAGRAEPTSSAANQIDLTLSGAEKDRIERLVPDARVEEVIRRDRYGSLYQAATNRGRIAVRLLDSDLAAVADSRSRVAEVIRKLSRLNHPHILPVLGIYEATNGAAWNPDLAWAMPWPAEDLGSHLKESQLEPGAAVAAVVSMLSAVRAAHNGGLICGELGPENIRIDGSGRLVLTEPGLAAAVSAPISTEVAEQNRDLWARMAPDQLEGAPADQSSDIYAVGLLLFELLTGSLPYPPVDSMAALISQRARQRPRSLGSLSEDIPAEMVEVADISVAGRPELRFHSANEFAAKLISAADSWLGPRWHRTQPFRLGTS